jgi:hypothetical protein
MQCLRVIHRRIGSVLADFDESIFGGEAAPTRPVWRLRPLEYFFRGLDLSTLIASTSIDASHFAKEQGFSKP